jgi:hypothetical protein
MQHPYIHSAANTLPTTNNPIASKTISIAYTPRK